MQPNNRAGIQGSSCMEIIFNIQTTITAASNLKKPLFIMIQDLSKAYDRVDIPLLKKALERICIPSNIISFILLLFTNRSNRVIFEDWIGEPYDIITGINYTSSIPRTCYFPNNINPMDEDKITETSLS
ncbi:unnamed protein product [Rhizophagus irregularis]|nr:unnamed protein product [Rhizophagus irregularis]